MASAWKLSFDWAHSETDSIFGHTSASPLAVICRRRWKSSVSMASGGLFFRNGLVADEIHFVFVEDFAVEMDYVRGNGTINIVSFGCIFIIWVGLFVEFVDFPGW